MTFLSNPYVFPLLLPVGSGSSGTVPAPSTAERTLLAPSFTSGPSGRDETRPWVSAVVDGIPVYANGWDQPWYWDEGANYYDIGSAAPTTFSVADDSGGTTFPLGTVLVYYLVFYNSATGEESAPQLTGPDYGVTHTMVATKDALIQWTNPGGKWTHARIYRRLQNSDNFKLVASVAVATATYTDASTDASLATADAYVWTYRTTLPLILKGVAVFENRLWGWTGEDSSAYYAQTWRADSRMVGFDFPEENVLQIEANDEYGPLVSMTMHFGAFYAKKRHAVYEIAGSDPTTFQMRRLFSGRGVLSHRTAVEAEGLIIDLDEQGVYLWTPGGEPLVAGAPTGSKDSPLSSVWERLNLAAADTFYAINDTASGLYLLHVALDFEPTPNWVIPYDYRNNRFLSDPVFYGSAGGYLQDAAGARHRCRVDDLGYLWEDDYGDSDGVLAGTSQAPLTAGTAILWTCGAAAFDTTLASGVAGSAIERYDSSLNLLDQNRCFAVAATTLTPLYFSTTSTPAAGHVAKVGVIPGVWQLGRLSFGTAEMKAMTQMVLEHDVESVSTDMLIESAADEDSFATLENLALDGTTGRTIVGNLSDRGWNWHARGQLRDAGVNCAIRVIELTFTVPGTQR